ncbi:MAG: hypothetical protein WBA88_26825 [Pseudaminobacter sp.]
MELVENETIVDSNLDRRIDLLALEPAGEGLTAFDFKMLLLTGIVAPTLLLLWGWA